jgi:hypothetical protein
MQQLRRGDRFPGDTPSIALYIERSKNQNIVVYDAKPVQQACAAPPDAIQSYWLDIDPAYVAKARAEGRLSDRVDLSLIERKLAYGHSVASSGPFSLPEVIPGMTSERLALTFVAVPSREMELRWLTDADQLPVILAAINNSICILSKIFVQSTEPKRFYQLPRVEYIDLIGVTLDGEAVSERIMAGSCCTQLGDLFWVGQ